MSKREDILAATADLLWERGYESSSPRMILEHSGAGQGSLYHHFNGKKDLAIAAMERHERVLTEAALAILADHTLEPLARVRRWLAEPREALRGCRLGRFAQERTVREDPELRQPLENYLRGLQACLTALLESAAAARGIRLEPAAEDLASMLLAVIQGGYVISQGTAEEAHLARAQRAAEHLLARSFPNP